MPATGGSLCGVNEVRDDGSNEGRNNLNEFVFI